MRTAARTLPVDTACCRAALSSHCPRSDCVASGELPGVQILRLPECKVEDAGIMGLWAVRTPCRQHLTLLFRGLAAVHLEFHARPAE